MRWIERAAEQADRLAGRRIRQPHSDATEAGRCRATHRWDRRCRTVVIVAAFSSKAKAPSATLSRPSEDARRSGKNGERRASLPPRCDEGDAFVAGGGGSGAYEPPPKPTRNALLFRLLVGIDDLARGVGLWCHHHLR